MANSFSNSHLICLTCGQEVASSDSSAERCPNCGSKIAARSPGTAGSRLFNGGGRIPVPLVVALILAGTMALVGVSGWLYEQTKPFVQEPPPPEPPPPKPPPPDPVTKGGRLVVRGQKLMAQGERQNGRDVFAQATELEPENAFAWANLGAAEMVLGKNGAGLAAYKRALVLDPDLWLARYNLGLHFARSGRPLEALDQLEQSISTLRREQSAQLTQVLADLRHNPAFGGLRNETRFQRLVDP